MVGAGSVAVTCRMVDIWGSRDAWLVSACAEVTLRNKGTRDHVE